MSAIRHGKMKAIIEDFDSSAKALKLIYLFDDFDILPLSPEMEISAELWEQFKHIWLDCIRLGIQIEIASGNYTDANDVTVLLTERYIVEFIEMPDALIPKDQVILATVLDVQSFLDFVKGLFIYTTVHVTYRGQSTPEPTIPQDFLPVHGPMNTNWFVPPLFPLTEQYETGNLLVAYETQTPEESGYENFPYNFFTVVHPCFLFYFLNYNLTTNFQLPEVSPLYDETWEIDPNYQCPDTATLLSSGDQLDAYFKSTTAAFFEVSEESLQGGGLLYYGYRNDYYCGAARYQHWHYGCPYHQQYYWAILNLGGDAKVPLRRIESAWCYGSPGTIDRPLTTFLIGVPPGIDEWFDGLASKGYQWLDDTIPDTVTERTMYQEWVATGGDGVEYNHYGGIVGSTQYPELLMIDRLIGALADYGSNPLASGGQPFTFFRYHRYNSDRQEGTVTLGGYELPEGYKVYYGGGYSAPNGGFLPTALTLLLMEKATAWAPAIYRPYSDTVNSRFCTVNGESTTVGQPED